MPKFQISVSNHLFLVLTSVIILISIISLNAIMQHLAYAQSPRPPVTLPSTPTANTYQINFRIDGLDYSDRMAQVWITVKGMTSAKNINPIALLDAQHAEADLIVQVPFDFPNGLVKPGDQFTACIKILSHAPNPFGGRTSACQTGTINSGVGIRGQSQSQTVNLTL
jgi:hypothetical protein